MAISKIISFKPKQVLQKLPQQLEDRVAFGLLVAIAAFSLLGWLYVSHASAVTTTNYEVEALRLALGQLRHKNAGLTLEIAQLESLARVEQRALELSFVPANRIEYLKVDEYPPLSAQDIATYQGVEPVDAATVTQDALNQPASWLFSALDNVAAWVE